jgi:hypothetical protein
VGQAQVHLAVVEGEPCRPRRHQSQTPQEKAETFGTHGTNVACPKSLLDRGFMAPLSPGAGIEMRMASGWQMTRSDHGRM